MKVTNISDTLKPVKTVYKHDTNVNIDEKSFTCRDGFSGHLNTFLSEPSDHKIASNAFYTVTNKKRARTMLSLEPPVTDYYPRSFITYFVFDPSPGRHYTLPLGSNLDEYPGADRGAMFLNIDEDVSDTVLSRDYVISENNPYTQNIPFQGVDNNRLFRVELLTETTCRIHHDDGYLKTCLTYNDMSSSSSNLSFTPLDESSNSTSHPQVFNFTIYDIAGYIVLTKTLSNGVETFIVQNLELEDGVVTNSNLVGAIGPFEGGWPIKALIKCRRSSLLNTQNNIYKAIDATWNVYDDSWRYQNDARVDVTQSEVRDWKIDNTKYYLNSYISQLNNYLVDIEFNSLSANELPYNFTPLKNQLTPEGFQAENNPHSVAKSSDFCLDFHDRRNTDFRTYHKWYTGTNQVRADDQYNLGYTAYTETVSLKQDAVTYFHLPNSLKPFTWMNINYRRVPEYPDALVDRYTYLFPWQQLPVSVPGSFNYNYEDFVGLIRAGAIAGSNPMASDKIFKKRADYRFYSDWGDSGMPGNRDDSHYGTWLCAWLQAAPTDEDEKKYGPVWMDRYYDDTKFSEHQAMELPVNAATCKEEFISLFDSTEGYIDVPSELRLERGVQYAYHHIGNNDTKQIIEAFSKYAFHEDIINYTTIDDSGIAQRGLPDRENDYNVYEFTGKEFGRTAAPDPAHGDFRISFWMYSDNWSEPFGHQILGNYSDKGAGVVNDDIITPFGIVIYNDRICFTNTSGRHILTLLKSQYTDAWTRGDDATINVARQDPLGNITVFASIPNYTLVNVFNINGVVVDTIVQEGGPLQGKGKVIDISQSDQYVYALFEASSAAVVLDLSTEKFEATSNDNFADITVEGLDGDKNGLYTPIETDAINDKPVYANQGASPYYMVFDGEKWFITENHNFTLGEGGAIGNIGVVPETFQSQNNVGVTGRAEAGYDSANPKSIHLSPVNTNTYTKIMSTNTGSIFIMNGDASAVSPAKSKGGTNKLYYSNNGNVFSRTITVSSGDVTSGDLVLSLQHWGGNYANINNLKIDRDNFLWVMYDNRYISKYDTVNFIQRWTCDLHNIVDTKSQASVDFSQINTFDLVSEYAEGGDLQHYGIVYNYKQTADRGSWNHVYKINEDGVISLDSSFARPGLQPKANSQQTELTWFNSINYKYKDVGNSLTFKFMARNKFNPSDYVDVSQKFEVTSLAPGWHHFCFGFDANLRGIGYFYVDGRMIRPDNKGPRDYHSTHSSAEFGKYGFTRVIDKICTVGATQSLNNVTLADYLQKPGYYFSKNFKIKSLRMYNFNLFHDYVKTLAREHLEIQPINWTIPCGRRSHLDHVQSFHVHRLPGFKTSDFEIELVDTAVPEVQKIELEQELATTIIEYTPLSDAVITFNWISSRESTA